MSAHDITDQTTAILDITMQSSMPTAHHHKPRHCTPRCLNISQPNESRHAVTHLDDMTHHNNPIHPTSKLDAISFLGQRSMTTHYASFQCSPIRSSTTVRYTTLRVTTLLDARTLRPLSVQATTRLDATSFLSRTFHHSMPLHFTPGPHKPRHISWIMLHIRNRFCQYRGRWNPLLHDSFSMTFDFSAPAIQSFRRFLMSCHAASVLSYLVTNSLSFHRETPIDSCIKYHFKAGSPDRDPFQALM